MASTITSLNGGGMSPLSPSSDVSSDDVVIETNLSMFISCVIKSAGDDEGLKTKMIEGVKHFEVILYLSHNFDCTTGWKFSAKYDSVPGYTMRYNAIVEKIEYCPGFTVNERTTYYDNNGRRTIGSYTMRLTTYVPWTFRTAFYMIGISSTDASEPFYRDKLEKAEIGNLKVSDNVLTGYDGVVTTNLKSESLAPGQPSSTPTSEGSVSIFSSAQRFIETNSDGVYELRS